MLVFIILLAFTHLIFILDQVILRLLFVVILLTFFIIWLYLWVRVFFGVGQFVAQNKLVLSLQLLYFRIVLRWRRVIFPYVKFIKLSLIKLHLFVSAIFIANGFLLNNEAWFLLRGIILIFFSKVQSSLCEFMLLGFFQLVHDVA
jgi:hypothetical protein